MANDMHNNKPSRPAPPLNALRTPEPKGKSPVHRSVYDEIAERRKNEKHKIGVSSSDSREEIPRRFSDEVSDILDEVRMNKEDEDVKVYDPEKDISEPPTIPEYPTDIYSDDDEVSSEFENEDNFDVPPIPKARKRIGPWVAVITALSALCVIAAGAYGVVNGYFDGLISML